MPIYPYVCKCGNKFEVTLSVEEYENFKVGRCDKCDGKMKRSYEGVKTSFFCGRTIEPHEWNYNKKTGEFEDGHKKTLRKQKEGIDIESV